MRQIVSYLLISCALFGGQVLGKNQDAEHATMSENHRVIKDHVARIKNGFTKNNRVQYLISVEETGKLIETATVLHHHLEKAIGRKYKATARLHHDLIRKQYQSAARYYQELTSELKKPKADQENIWLYASQLQCAIEKAEYEQQLLRRKTFLEVSRSV